MPRVEPAELEAFAQSVVEAFGTPSDVADSVATSLVNADVRGHGSHGVRRLSTLYPDMIDQGDLVPDARPTVLDETDLRAVIDGNRGWGHHAGQEGISKAVDRAEGSGFGIVTIRNAAHLGRIGEFAERAADRGYVAICLTNTGGEAPMIAPPGSAERRLATNPYAIGVPTFEALPFSVVLDTSMSNVSHGKIMKKHVAGEPIPEGWAVDEDGSPLKDAAAFEAGEGAILPIGGQSFGYKGAGFSMAAELLVGMLADGHVLGDDVGGLVNNGCVFVVVDPSKFSDVEDDERRVAAFLDHLEASTFLDAVPTGEAWGDRTYLPGQPEYDTRCGRDRDGIPLDDGTVRKLNDVADEFGVDARPAEIAADR